MPDPILENIETRYLREYLAQLPVGSGSQVVGTDLTSVLGVLNIDAIEAQVDAIAVAAVGPAILASYASQPVAEAGLINNEGMTPLRSKQQLMALLPLLTPEQFGALGDGMADDTLALDSMNAASVTGQMMFFGKKYIHSGEFELKGGRTYFGSSFWDSGIKLKDGANKNLAVADRWLQSSQSLGRTCTITGLDFDGNKANNVSGNALMPCHFRPIIRDIRVRNAANDNIHMPTNYKNGTVFAANSVGARLLDIRSEGCLGRHLFVGGGEDGEDTTYTDCWLMNFTAGVGGTSAVYIEPASGWFVDNTHASALTGHQPYYFGGASSLFVNNVYCESFGTDDPSLTRSVVTVNKVKPGAGVFISNVGCKTSGKPNSSVVVTGVSIAGGASPDQYASISNIHVRNASDHDYNLGYSVSCSSGGTLTLDVSEISSDYITRPRRQSGSGTIIIREHPSNAWNFGTAAPSPVTNGFWSAGQVVNNTDATSLIERWLCTASGNSGTWVGIYRNRTIPGKTDRGDVSASISPLTATRVQRWNSPITADRTATLTSPYLGANFRFIRSAASTGAFNLIVSDGSTIKTLSSGQWADVEYDGAAWVLTASGSL